MGTILAHSDPQRRRTFRGTYPLTPGPFGPALYLGKFKNAVSPLLFGLRCRSPRSPPMPGPRRPGPLPFYARTPHPLVLSRGWVGPDRAFTIRYPADCAFV